MFAVDKQMEAGLERGCATVGVTWAGTQGLHKTPGSAPSMQGWGGGGAGHLCVREGPQQIATSHVPPVRVAQPLCTSPHRGGGRQMSLSTSERRFF